MLRDFRVRACWIMVQFSRVPRLVRTFRQAVRRRVFHGSRKRAFLTCSIRSSALRSRRICGESPCLPPSGTCARAGRDAASPGPAGCGRCRACRGTSSPRRRTLRRTRRTVSFLRGRASDSCSGATEGKTGNVRPFNPVPCSQGLNARESCICFWTSQANCGLHFFFIFFRFIFFQATLLTFMNEYDKLRIVFIGILCPQTAGEMELDGNIHSSEN